MCLPFGVSAGWVTGVGVGIGVGITSVVGVDTGVDVDGACLFDVGCIVGMRLVPCATVIGAGCAVGAVVLSPDVGDGSCVMVAVAVTSCTVEGVACCRSA